MEDMKKLLILIGIILIIFLGERFFTSYKSEKLSKDKRTYKVKMEKFTYDKKGRLVDINTGDVEDFVAGGVSMGIAKKIIDYRDITGGYRELIELRRIKGIGEKTYEKIVGKVEVGSSISRKKLIINKASDKELGYYGFSKKEIRKIRTHIEKEGRIFDNLVLLKLIGEERYDEYSNGVKY